MLINQRIIWKDDTALKDLSVKLNRFVTGTETIAFVSADDYLYIGSDLPFNHRYFLVSTANDQASVASVSIWSGSVWDAAVDVIDQTDDGTGTTLAQSGIISWAKDRNESWGLEETTENITALSSLKIYNKYWIRIGFDADLAASTAIQYVGHKFADDEDLKTVYPDLVQSKVLTAFQSGKTNWDEQHCQAAEDIVSWLRSRGDIWSSDQVFNWDQFRDAAIHRCAYWIMFGFGDDYIDERALAEKEYFRGLNKQNFQTDQDGDGTLDRDELVTSTKWRRR